jgi:DNA-binding NtrC family response regulator
VLLSCSDTLTVQDFALGRRVAVAASSGFAFQLPEEGCSLEAVEQSLVLQALARVNNNQTRAAKLLGLSRDQLRYKMEKHGIRTRGTDSSA